MERKKVFVNLFLLSLVVGTVGFGLYFKHYFVVSAFLAWLCLEYLTVKLGLSWSWFSRSQVRVHSLAGILDLYGKYDTVSEHTLESQIAELRRENTLTSFELRWLERLKDLIVLRSLIYGAPVSGKRALRRALAFALRESEAPAAKVDLGKVSVADITEASLFVGDLYWKLYEVAVGEYPDLSDQARHLFERIFRKEFDTVTARAVLEGLTDTMQRDFGVPFLIVNLLNTGNMDAARTISQSLLTEETELDEELCSTLYWMSEVKWFVGQDEGILNDFESTIRYLYHLCFSNPERAGFLEVDSQFFAQFEVVSELAQEGFLFKELLVEKVLALWKDQEGYYDSVFQGVMETLTRVKSKIYDERDAWELYWKRESEGFSRDYLYVIEGNLSYAQGHINEAKACYEKAIKINPKLRSAALNLVFCHAKAGTPQSHDHVVERLLQRTELLPASLYVAGDSYLLRGDTRKADLYYNILRKQQGWALKVDYYISMFCFENSLFSLALKHAERAHELNRHDSAISYHLSLCFNAVGEKDRALALVKGIDAAPQPQWLNYYRFTLERDSGRHIEASETLLQIPQDYFQDPEELEAALDFAKHRKDLVLLRHLRRKA